MSMVPHTILRPFGVNPCVAGGHLRRHHARLCLRRASAVAATSGNELGGSNNRRRKKQAAEESRLEVLYDDGFGSVTMKDYWEAVRAMPKDDGGPPRWFCPVECGRPEMDRAPLLLFLPGTDGVGMELILHHQSLGKVFEPPGGKGMAGGETHLWESFKAQITGKLEAGKIKIEIPGSKPSWEKTSRRVTARTKIPLAGKARAGKLRPDKACRKKTFELRIRRQKIEAGFPPRSLPTRSRARQEATTFSTVPPLQRSDNLSLRGCVSQRWSQKA